MYAFPIRTAALALAATVGLSACTTPFGYGGVGAGIGNNGYYDPYYGGYGYGAGYPSYASGYGSGYAPYYGWYDGYYYPGSGYYVYDRYRRPHRWTDDVRDHWEGRRAQAMSSKEFRRQMEALSQNWDAFDAGPDAVSQQRVLSDGRKVRAQQVQRAERSSAARAERTTRVERSERNNGNAGRQSGREFRDAMTRRANSIDNENQ